MTVIRWPFNRIVNKLDSFFFFKVHMLKSPERVVAEELCDSSESIKAVINSYYHSLAKGLQILSATVVKWLEFHCLLSKWAGINHTKRGLIFHSGPVHSKKRSKRGWPQEVPGWAPWGRSKLETSQIRSRNLWKDFPRLQSREENAQPYFSWALTIIKWWISFMENGPPDTKGHLQNGHEITLDTEDIFMQLGPKVREHTTQNLSNWPLVSGYSDHLVNKWVSGEPRAEKAASHWTCTGTRRETLTRIIPKVFTKAFNNSNYSLGKQTRPSLLFGGREIKPFFVESAIYMW